MTVSRVYYMNSEKTVVDAIFDGVEYKGLDLYAYAYIPQQIVEWLNAGNVGIPFFVPMWAVRTVLQTNNLFDQAQALINASSDIALKNIWEYGNNAQRTSPAINSLASALGLNDAQVDQMFIDANNLTV